nr:nucleotide-binding alpha-beta plait domain-containing protein [Tanacetum cinerariifolium]
MKLLIKSTALVFFTYPEKHTPFSSLSMPLLSLLLYKIQKYEDDCRICFEFVGNSWWRWTDNGSCGQMLLTWERDCFKLVSELWLIQMARRVSDYRIRRITDRGNEEDGPDSRARAYRFYDNRRSANRGNEKVDRDPGNISEIKGLRRR